MATTPRQSVGRILFVVLIVFAPIAGYQQYQNASDRTKSIALPVVFSLAVAALLLLLTYELMVYLRQTMRNADERQKQEWRTSVKNRNGERAY